MLVKVNNGVMDYYINVNNIEEMRQYPDVTNTQGTTLFTQLQMVSGEKHVVKGNCEDLVVEFKKSR